MGRSEDVCAGTKRGRGGRWPFQMAPAEDRRREPWGLEADYEPALQENLCQGHHLMHLRS